MSAVHTTGKGAPRTRCPRCGGTLTLVLDGLVGSLICPPFFIEGKSKLEYRMDRKPFVACSGCEFCQEITYART